MSDYASKYTDKRITAAQWMAELMCERQAAMKKQALPQHFWNLDQWKKPYKLQLMYANSLLKVYDLKAIGIALRKPAGRKIFSLNAKWFHEIVAEEDRKLKVQKQLQAEHAKCEVKIETVETDEKRPVFVAKKSIKSTLKDL